MMLNIFKKNNDLESNSQEKPLPKPPKTSPFSSFLAFFSKLGSKIKNFYLSTIKPKITKFNVWFDRKYPKIAKYKLAILIFLILLIVGLFIIIIVAATGGFSPQEDTGINGSNISGKGDGTFYNPSVGIGACGWQNYDNELVAAMNKPQYGTYENSNNSPVCGICIKISGPNGSVKVKIVDECPVCKKGDIDMSPRAFKEIANLDDGRVPISWQGC